MDKRDRTTENLEDYLSVLRQEIAKLKTLREKAALAERALWAPEETPDEWTALHLWYRRALADNERLRNALVEMTMGYVWIVDLNLNYTFVSPSVSNFLGYTAEELVGRNSAATLTPASREELKNVFRGRIAQATSPLEPYYPTDTVEIERFHKDGSIRRHKITGTFLKNLAGKPVGVLGIARDVTGREPSEDPLRKSLEELEDKVSAVTLALFRVNEELKMEILERVRAEEALRRSEQRYRELFQQAPILITEQDRSEAKRYMDGLRDSGVTNLREYFRKNPEEALRVFAMTGVLAINRAGKDFLGVRTPEELQNWYVKISRAMEFESVLEQLLDIHAGPRDLQKEMTVQTLDGETRHALASWHIMEGYEQTLDRVWVSAIDITDLKRAEIALRESEERFRTVFEAAQDFMFLKDTELRYTHVNSAMLSLLGMGPEQIIGKTDEDLFPAEWAQRMKALEKRVLAGQEIETEQNLLCIAQPLTYNFARFPMRDTSGTTVGLCGIGRDVTQRRGSQTRVEIQTSPPGSSVMKRTMELVRLAARTESVVLFKGESGSGKDYLAEYLHRHSGRASGPYFAINCAAVASALAESELFGHEPGAFTGARARKRGLLELAEGGTLLLNEVGELSPELQAKLLSFLDTQMITRVGGERNIQVNTRIVAATNRDIDKDVRSGRFRQDLFYRLNVFVVEVPPLRDRMEDLPSIAEELLPVLCQKVQLAEVPAVDPEAVAVLARYNWPGNVRELRNILERARILCDKKRITKANLSLGPGIEVSPPRQGELAVTVHMTQGGSMNDILEQTKRLLVAESLRQSRGSIKEAARSLGVSRDSLVHHMKSLGIQRDYFDSVP